MFIFINYFVHKVKKKGNKNEFSRVASEEHVRGVGERAGQAVPEFFQLLLQCVDCAECARRKLPEEWQGADPHGQRLFCRERLLACLRPLQPLFDVIFLKNKFFESCVKKKTFQVYSWKNSKPMRTMPTAIKMNSP